MSATAAPLQALFERQLRLCDQLEALADQLPDGLDRQHCLHVARQIGPLLAAAHRAEEALLFPRVAAGGDQGAELVERLRLEHLEDECFADELQYELLQLGQGRPVLGPETTGYMLRGFFEGLRRHVRHETELLARFGGEAAILSVSRSAAAVARDPAR